MSLLLGVVAVGAGQTPEAPPATPARLFEAGNYDAAAGQVQQRMGEGDVAPADVYWAGQSLSRLNRHEEAASLFGRLGGDADDDAWRAVGRSAIALEQGNPGEALAQAVRATELAPDLFFAHYQLGRARFQAQQWAAAATALDRAAELDGGAAYAHYYAGTAYNRLKRIDPMVIHFRRFLDLAPQAPERASVEQVLKLIAGMR